ncbi:STN domain-containing protein, partial [Acinetobacter baumannii]
MKKAGMGQKRNRSIFRFSTLAFAMHAVSMGGLVALSMQQVYAETAGVKSYNIPAGRLANVLNQFAEQSGTSIAMDAQQLQGLHSLGLKGNFAVEQGFEQLLKATEFNAIKVGQGYTLTKKSTPRVTSSKVQAASLPPSSAVIEEDASVRLTPIVVYGKEDRDTEGYNKVYDANRSSVYAGKDYVERFKGTNPADVLQ